MTKEEILSYVMNSPEDTNYSVLKDMLDRLDTGGSSGGDFMIELDLDESIGYITMNKTWQEIYDAFYTGKYIAAFITQSNGSPVDPDHNGPNYVSDVQNNYGTYEVHLMGYSRSDMKYYSNVAVYSTDSADDYPRFELGD